MNRISAHTKKLFRRFLLLGSVLAFLAPSGVRGDKWTNTAGNAVEATLVSLDHGVVVFQRPDGSQFDVALASLSAGSRQRVLNATGEIEVPERLRSDFGLYVRTLKRLNELHRAGKMGDEERMKQSAVIQAQFEKTCGELNIPEARRKELLQLAQRL